ncbi:MAG: DUF2238 domain-containing protein [Phycisphaerales bacterium]|nr:DUF2238 domain-containing protein [Phycisphaerales bacterium]
MMIRRYPWVTAFTALYVVGFLALALRRGNTEFLFYGAVMLLLIGLVIWADARARFSTAVVWMLSVWGFLHMAGGVLELEQNGETVALYSYWLVPEVLKYDKLIHCYGFFAATFAVWEALRRFLREELRTGLALFVIVASAGMGLGAFNEVVEYTATVISPETNVGGYVNNAQDLVANMIGAGLAAAVLWVRAGAQTKAPPPSRVA